MSKCFTQAFGPLMKGLGHGHAAWCGRAKHQAPGEASLGDQSTDLPWTKENQLPQQEKIGGL